MESETIAEHLNDPAEALYRQISLAARDLRRGMGAEFRKWGITGQQFGVLLGAVGGARISEIAEQLLTDPTSAGRIVERMEAAGLVERYRQPADRRVVWVRLLPGGEEVLSRCLPLHVERTRELLEVLNGEERHALTAVLAKIRGYLAAGDSAIAE